MKRNTVDVDLLRGQEREKFFDEFQALADSIFLDMKRTYLTAFFDSREHVRSKFEFLQAPDGRVVGFTAVSLFNVVIDERSYDVFRVMAGVVPAFRGRNMTSKLPMQWYLAHRLLHPFRTIVMLAGAMHPSSYAMLSRASEVWPRYDRPTPPATRDLMVKLCNSFGWKFADTASSALIVYRPDSARLWPGEDEFWKTQGNRAARYFLRENPNFAQGDAMVVLSPVSWTNIVRSSTAFFYKFFRTNINRRMKPE